MAVAWTCSVLAQQTARGTHMSDRKILLLSPSKWLAALWIVSTLLITTIWWAGLAWSAIKLAESMS